MRKKIKLFDPVIGKEELDAVSNTIKSHFWASGSGIGKVKKFENEFRKYIHSQDCIAVNSGTAALNLALSLHNIKNMDAFLHKKSGKTAEIIINLAPSATRRFILSGTPMPNRWDDIWTQFNFLWPLLEILDKAQYFKDFTKTRQELGPGYKKIIDPLFTRIAKKTLDLK